MKKQKRKPELDDWIRPSYTPSDFGRIVRGKCAKRAAAVYNVTRTRNPVLLESA